MCYGKSVDIVAMYNREQKWVPAVWADALEIGYKFYRNYRYYELSGMDVYSDYTKYLLKICDDCKLLGIGRGCGQWAWPGDMIREGAYFPRFQPLSQYCSTE